MKYKIEKVSYKGKKLSEVMEESKVIDKILVFSKNGWDCYFKINPEYKNVFSDKPGHALFEYIGKEARCQIYLTDFGVRQIQNYFHI